MSTEIAGMSFVLGILALVVVLASQVLKTWQARLTSKAEVARDEAYRKLAEESTSVQQKMAKDLADLHVRIASIEKMLREVD